MPKRGGAKVGCNKRLDSKESYAQYVKSKKISDSEDKKLRREYNVARAIAIELISI